MTTPARRRVTRRQSITAAAYVFGGDRMLPTYAQLATRFGLKSRSAICDRLRRFRDSLAVEQRERYLAAVRRGHAGKRIRMSPVQLSMVDV